MFYFNGCVFQWSYDVLEKIKQALKSTLKLLLGRWGWSLICYILCPHFHKYLLSLFFFYWKFLSGRPHFSSLLQIYCQLPNACSLDPPPSTTLPFQPLYPRSYHSPPTHIFHLQRLEFFPPVHLYGSGIPHPLSQERALTLSDPSSQKQQLGHGDCFPLW